MRFTEKTGQIVHETRTWNRFYKDYIAPVYSTHGSIPYASWKSDVLIGDRVKPTSYEELHIFCNAGSYISLANERTKTTGPAFTSATTIEGFPYVKNLHSQANEVLTLPSSESFDNGLIEAIEKIANTNFDAALALAEARETADTVTDLSKRALRLLVAVKKLDFKTLKKELKWRNGPTNATSPSEAWLQYRYGIMPTVYDVQGAIEVLSGKIARPMLTTVKGGTSTSLDKTWEEYYGYKTFTRTGKQTFRTSLCVRIKSEAYQTASEFGFTNLAGIAWEFIPFSFIVDWVTPIGSWLKALSIIPTVDFEHGSQSMQIQGSVHLNYDDNPTGSSYTRWDKSWDVNGYKRKPLSAIPIPLPRLQAPIRGVGDIDRVADLLSLTDVLTRKH